MNKMDELHRISEHFVERATFRISEQEAELIIKAEVIDGYHRLYCSITTIFDETHYIPITKDSDVTVGEILDPSRIMYVYWYGPTIITEDPHTEIRSFEREIAYLPIGD